MKLKAVVIMAAGVMFLATTSYGVENLTLKSEKEKASYAIGATIGNDVKKQRLDLDRRILMRGLKDALSGKKLLLTDQAMSETMAAVQREIIVKQAQAFKQAAEKNKQEGEAFLAENKKKEGVVTLPSGLQYKIMREGAGSIPKATDIATVNYRGTLINGNEFDNSYRRGEPAAFPVGGVIRGWSEALQLMKVGSKWQLFIPPELAYGEQGQGPIGPNATLIFEAELLSTKQETSPECKGAECGTKAGKSGP
jgi:FKBP-type peptidyl-prolyl cis-trans isomerase FklB